MHMLKRASLAAASAAATLALFAGPASAALSPDPYRTTSGIVHFLMRNSLGSSSCVLRSAEAALTGTAGGAIGQVTGFRPMVRYIDGCAGWTLTATYSSPMTVSVVRGDATFDMPIVFENTLGGTCAYRSSLRGTATSGGSRITASGLLVLDARIRGTCYTTLSTDLVAEFPGASISW